MRQPLATAALVFTIVGTLILGPVGYLWNGMAEDLKKKVDNTTLQLMIQKDREALARHTEDIKERELKDEKQDTAILENQKTLIIYQQALKAPTSLKAKMLPNVGILKKNTTPTNDSAVIYNKKPIPPELFAKYLELPEDIQIKYKKYLHAKGYDTAGLD